MTERLPGDVLAILRDTQEVEIETRAAPDVPPHRTTIWAVVDDSGRAFIRTYRGPGSRWYREATSSGLVTVTAGGQAIDVRLEAASDAESVAACSEALQRKYPHASGLRGMLAAENLPTTLELLSPAQPSEGRRGEGS